MTTNGWPSLKCECGHQAKWHKNGAKQCRRFGCSCPAFVEKPLVEIEDD